MYHGVFYIFNSVASITADCVKPNKRFYIYSENKNKYLHNDVWTDLRSGAQQTAVEAIATSRHALLH